MSPIKKWVFGLVWMSSAAFATDLYKIDPLHTFSIFEYSHFGLSVQRGRFDNNAGMIELDPETKTGSIEIQIETGSVSTGSEFFNRILRSEDFFDAANFPKIVFKSSLLRFEGERLAQVDGDLTIKGTTKPVVFEITHFNCRFMIVYGRHTCGANGFTKILRSDFNMGRYAPFVSDAVTLYFSVEGIHE